MYEYQAEGTEIYKNGELTQFNSKTNQNGKNKYVNIKMLGNKKYKIDGSSFKGETSSDYLIGTWWNHSIVEAKAQISAVSGRIIMQKVNFLGKYEQMFKALSLGIKDYLQKTYHSKVVIGLSGGIDSALTAAIAADALESKNIFGISMPSKYSSDHSIRDAELLASNLNINFDMIRIEDINKQFLDDLDSFLDQRKSGLAEENLQARIRGNILMTIANKENGLLLNTGNKTEMALGYCTLYGDMCGALAVISDLNKADVYGLAKWINRKHGKSIIPDSSIKKSPSAELSYNQVDPFDYEIVSPLIEEIIINGCDINRLVDLGYDYKLCKEMINKTRLFEYKRAQAAPGIRISQKAFGVGRRYPIINWYKV